MGAEEKAQSSGCGAPPNVLIRHRQPKRYAIRDFPEGCGPSKSFCAAAIKELNQFEVPVTVSNSKPKLGLLVSSDDNDKAKMELAIKVQVVEAEALDNAGLINVSKTSDNETTKLSKKAIVMQSKPYPPRRRISAIRCFPPGCGTKNVPVNIGVPSESTALKKPSGFSHKIPGLEKKEQATESHGLRKGAVSAWDRDKIQLGAKCLKFNKEKQFKNEMDKRLDGKSSGQYHRMNHLPKRASSDLEHLVPRMIVLGLMAPSKSPWKKRKTASTVKLMTDVAKTGAK